jgi:Ca2+/Na+ antiporter
MKTRSRYIALILASFFALVTGAILFPARGNIQFLERGYAGIFLCLYFLSLYQVVKSIRGERKVAARLLCALHGFSAIVAALLVAWLADAIVALNR